MFLDGRGQLLRRKHRRKNHERGVHAGQQPDHHRGQCDVSVLGLAPVAQPQIQRRRRRTAKAPRRAIPDETFPEPRESGQENARAKDRTPADFFAAGRPDRRPAQAVGTKTAALRPRPNRLRRSQTTPRKKFLPARDSVVRRAGFFRQPSADQQGQRGDRGNRVVLLPGREAKEPDDHQRPKKKEKSGTLRRRSVRPRISLQRRESF